jgi:hypothetical protein
MKNYFYFVYLLSLNQLFVGFDIHLDMDSLYTINSNYNQDRFHSLKKALWINANLDKVVIARVKE